MDVTGQVYIPQERQRQEQAVSSISSIKEEALDKGLKFPEEAILFFISKGESLFEMELNRESPLIPFKKAEEAFNGGIKEALSTGIPYLIETFRLTAGDFYWLINLVLLFSFILIASMVFAFFITSIIRLPVEVPLLIHEATEKKITTLYLIILIGGALTGLPYFAGSVLLLSAIHNPVRSQKTFVFFYLIFLLLLPFVLRLQGGLLKILSDPEIRAISAVNERKDNRLILTLAGSPENQRSSMVVKDNDSKVYLFSRAIALKREGKIDEAIEILKGLSTDHDYRVFNNLGNCLFLKGDLHGAEQYYQKAIELKRNPQSLYNLSQLYKERLDFEKGKNYYEEAMRLDAELISSFTKISSKAPNRFLMDIGLPQSELLKFSLQKARRYMRSVKIQEILFPLILFGLLFIRFPAIAYRCSRCGRIICNICQRRELWGRMCPDCYETLVTPDKVDSKTRLQRLLFVQKKKSHSKRFFWVLSIFPGVNQTLGGWLFQGLLIWSLLGISIMCLISANYFTIAGLRQFYIAWIGIVTGIFAIMIHLISLRRLSRLWP